MNASWLLRRELAGRKTLRRVALNNISFAMPGGDRWTLIANALHFLSATEIAQLDVSLRTITSRKANVVRLAARRSDVIIAPCSTMAERITTVLPQVGSRVTVRPHPVSPNSIPGETPGYRNSLSRHLLALQANEPEDSGIAYRNQEFRDPIRQSTSHGKLRRIPSPELANNPNIELLGQLSSSAATTIWARCNAIYYPTELESFGYPLAEARASGHPVIARDTAQNREIAGPALCPFTPDDPDSLQEALGYAISGACFRPFSI